MKLGPLTLEIEVSRERCQCGLAPMKVTVPVQVCLQTTGSACLTASGCTFDATLAINTAQMEHDAKRALTCRRCEA